MHWLREFVGRRPSGDVAVALARLTEAVTELAREVRRLRRAVVRAEGAPYPDFEADEVAAELPEF